MVLLSSILCELVFTMAVVVLDLLKKLVSSTDLKDVL